MAMANVHRYEAISAAPARRCPAWAYVGVMSLVWLPVLVFIAPLFFPI